MSLSLPQWENMLKRAIKSGGRAVDELRSLATTPAPNAIEWCARPEFLGSESIYDFFGSYQAVRDFFELLCPMCARPGDQTVWELDREGNRKAKSRQVLGSQPLLTWNVREEDDQCPKCRITRAELFGSGLVRGYNQMHCVIGQRAGKSFMGGSYLMTYFEHRLICAGYTHPGRLQGWFRAPPSDNYEVTLLASSEDQSKDTIWARFVNARRYSTWHQRVIPWISAAEKTQQTPNGMLPWRYSENQTTIEHGYLSLEFNSLNSNSKTARGRTRVMSALDEISYMQDGDGSFSAREIYAVQEASLTTVRKYAKKNFLPFWLGSIISITSPNHFEDFGMELLRGAPETPGMFFMHAPTWHFNPELPESEFEGIKRKDPFKWAKNFKADPPAGETPLIHDWGRWRHAVENVAGKPTADIITEVLDIGNGQLALGMKLRHAQLQMPDWQGNAPKPRVITLDAGATWDAFAIYCAHEGTNAQGELTSIQDFAYRIVPEPGVEPWYDSVVDLIVDLARYMPISMVRADRWNSRMVLQRLRLALPGVSVSDETPCTDEDVANFMRDGYGYRVVMLPGTEYIPGRPTALGGEPNLTGVGAEHGSLGSSAPVVLAANDDVMVLQAGHRRKDNDDETRISEIATMAPQSVVYHEMHKLQRDPKGRVRNPLKGKERGVNSDDLARCAAHAHKLIVERDWVRRENDNSRDARAKRARTAHEVMQARATGGSVQASLYGLGLNGQGTERPWTYQPLAGGRRMTPGQAAMPGAMPHSTRPIVPRITTTPRHKGVGRGW